MVNEQYVPIQLPSGCKPYPGVDPNNVKIRTLRGKDEELIAELSMTNVKRKFITLLQNILQGVDPKQLTSGDARYIMLWEGINSYSFEYPVKTICQNCLRDIELNIDLRTLEVKKLPEDFVQPYEVILSTGPVKLRLQTIQDEMNDLDFGNKVKSSYLFSYASTIVDDNIDVMAKMKMLEMVGTQDLRKMREFHTKYEHGPIMKTKYTCPKCEDEGEIIVPFRIDRFLFAGE